MSRWARRKDQSHNPIVELLEAHGKVCFDVSAIGSLGFDIIVFDPSQRRWMVFEIKSDRKVHHKSAETRLRPSQIRAAALAEIFTVSTGEEALRYCAS